MTKEIIEGNKLIRLFEIKGTVSEEEYKMRSIKHLRHFEDLKYHKSWDALMPVVEKINNVWWTEFMPKDIDEGIIEDKKNMVIMLPITTKIKVVWVAVVEFIKWYNITNNPSNK